jgi:PiT family inorganic phosphate transporter
MVAAWLITLPAAALVGALMWWVTDLLGGGLAGAVAVTAILVGSALAMYLRSRRAPVDHTNVNDDWEAAPAPERVPAGTAS